jgi:hypothetical protein
MISRMEKTIDLLQQALELVRQDLAENHDHDPDLRADEVCIEVPLTRYQKRLANAIELKVRQALS